MLPCRQNPYLVFTYIDELSIGAIAPNYSRPGFTTSEPTDLELVSTLAIALVVIYIKEKVQKLLKICMGVKELLF